MNPPLEFLLREKEKMTCSSCSSCTGEKCDEPTTRVLIKGEGEDDL